MTSEPAKRRKRRNEEELIEDLEAKVREVERRMQRRRAKSESPIAKDFQRLKKHMSKFAQICLDKKRPDVANTVMGFMNVLERQSNQVEAES